jgi:hypothetical protein
VEGGEDVKDAVNAGENDEEGKLRPKADHLKGGGVRSEDSGGGGGYGDAKKGVGNADADDDGANDSRDAEAADEKAREEVGPMGGVAR